MKRQQRKRADDIARKMSPHLRKALSAESRRKAGGSGGGRTMRILLEVDRRPSRGWVESLKRGFASRGYRFQVLRRMPRLRLVSAIVSIPCLRTLCRHRRVTRVHLDRKVRVRLNVATPSVGASALQSRGSTGKGVAIAIIDTGVYPHPDLTKPVNRIAAFRDFVGGRTKPYDDNGHGTHVAGDAAGNGFSSKGKYRGPASGAKLVVAKAFDRNGEGNSSDIVAAIDWVLRVRKKYGIRVVNMSFGLPGVSRCSDDPICRAAERAWRSGLVVVASAGNDGPGPRTVTSPGISPLLLTVGAVDDRRTVRQADDRVAAFSGRGPIAGGRTKPDLTAPGVGIVSLRAPGSAIDRDDPSARVGARYFKLTGTSMAAPIVAGGAAQLLQKRPRLSPAGVKRLLKRGAFRLKAPRNAQGSGELDLRFAVK
ncbi:S8 family peptidase [Paenibacillus flagellatus]|nr:S8 family peptidase [Paenibacillus flagellatus]